ncbi:hypothetical protein [Sorangium sp. So ce1182]|uniref:hypothetical protein n=1 Tax=Sorangium sp. So ce1182 TaxID=3133334 RepID=UPI003F62B6D9
MRSTFWAGVVGVCLACCLPGLGCGGDDEAAAAGEPAGAAGGGGAGEAAGGGGAGEAAGGGGAGEAAGGGGAGEAAGGGGAGEASCSGLDPSAVVDDLTDAEVEQACRGYRKCSVGAISVEYICRMMGVLGAKFGDDPGTDDAGLQARCTEQYESCMADPSQAEALLEQAIADIESAPCLERMPCTATIAEIDACAAAMGERSLNVLPECSVLTLEFYDQDHTDEAVTAACGKLDQGCLAVFAVPEDE